MLDDPGTRLDGLTMDQLRILFDVLVQLSPSRRWKGRPITYQSQIRRRKRKKTPCASRFCSPVFRANVSRREVSWIGRVVEVGEI